MANMSYCRFENTSRDLEDCIDAIHNGKIYGLNQYERKGLIRLVELATEIVEDLSYDIEEALNEDQED